jgi:hypothetical protein
MLVVRYVYTCDTGHFYISPKILAVISLDVVYAADQSKSRAQHHDAG